MARKKALQTGESQRADGRYMYRYSTDNGKRICIYAKTLDELRKKEKEIIKNQALGYTPSNLTLNEAFNLLMESKTIRDSTRKDQMNVWRLYVREDIGNCKISDIKNINIKQFLKRLAECRGENGNGLRITTIKNIFSLVNSTFEMCVDNEFLLKNPCRNTLKTVEAKKKREKKALSEQQINDLIQFCNSSACYNIYSPLLTILFQTGMRNGEWTGLCWRDVDFENRIIHVDHQLIYKDTDGTGYKFHIHKPKTEAGCRVINMSNTVYQAFLKQKEIYKILDRHNKAIIDGYGGFCFLTSNGMPYSVAGVNDILKHIEKAYNKKNPEKPIPHLSSHILRHSAASLMVSKGMNPPTVAKILGHTDVSMTLNVYTHDVDGASKQEIQKLNNAISL